jgi:hypothetical protein
MNAPTWESAKHLLGEYDGAATEIFVVGLPLLQLPVVIASFADLPALEVLSFENEALDPAEPFDANWRSRFESTEARSCQHSLRSANGTARHLQMYLWIDSKAGMLEVELVFWNDLTFPESLEIEDCRQRLAGLVSLADACRTGVPRARCILAAEHNGPTEELEKPGRSVVVW